MKTPPNNPGRWLTVVLFASAMAWVEAAVVFYLRTMINRIEPYQADPLPIIGGLGPVEMVREAATLLMLAAVGLLAGWNWRSRLGFFSIAFGVWDICYYLFLRKMCGWPHSLLDWDILFLLPLPWWGPVLAPVSIAALMILWGTLASQFAAPKSSVSPAWTIRLMNFLGFILALYVFMADSIRVMDGGVPALRTMLPARFNWVLFALAMLLIAAPIVENALWIWRHKLSPNLKPQAAELP